MSQSIKPFLVFLLLVILSHCASAATNQFKHWYPEFGFVFERILQRNCSVQYAKYLAAKVNYTDIDRWNGGAVTNALAQPVVDCILKSTSEFIKTNMASADVLLGLTPTILAAVGSSAYETSLLFIIAKRPFLALCLSIGSPAVFPIRSFDYRDPIGALKEREGRLHPPRFPFGKGVVVVIIEYAVALASIANVATLSYQLGIQAPCTFAPQLTYLPLLWAVLGVSIHISGAFALYLRARVSSGRSRHSVLDWVKILFMPVAKQKPLAVQVVPETYLFILVSFFTSILTICHIIYGTLAFSSMLFVSVRDSIAIIGRYMASAMCCRVILMYELAILRDSFNVSDGHRVELGFDKKNNDQTQTR
ncbi:MAG: hypothetical protein M1840_008397 [Geoglossum simile]|nr:MAG: hypothetical protein M1840_008397 [Geoglossum simile]